MHKRVRNLVGATVLAAAVVVTPLAGASAMAAPGAVTEAQQSGLVNVSLRNTSVTVPIQVAANICNLGVNVLSQQLAAGGGMTTCTNRQGQPVTITQV